MESALEEIEFLALSPNRVEALTLLAEEPRTRRELAELTDASQPTLGRILGDFQERTWVIRDGSDYVATATGQLVAAGFTELLDVLDTEATLRGVVRWLPTDALEFDLRRLSSATVTTPSQVRPNAPVKRALDLLREAEDVRIFSYAFNEQSLDVIHDRTAEGAQTFRGVFAASAIDALADDSQLRARLVELLDTKTVEIRITDEAVPLATTVADDTVHLFLRDDNGLLQASLDVADEAVHDWASERFERYWAEATPLAAADL